MKKLYYCALSLSISLSLQINGMQKQSAKPPYLLFKATTRYTIFTRKDRKSTDKSPFALITFNTNRDQKELFKFALSNPNNAKWTTDFIAFKAKCKTLTTEELENFKDMMLFKEQSKLLGLRIRREQRILRKNIIYISEALHYRSLKKLIRDKDLPNPLIIEYLSKSDHPK